MRDLKIKLNFSSDTVALVNAQNEIGNLKKRLSNAEKSAKKLDNSYSNMLVAIGGTAAVVAVAKSGFDSIQDGFKKLEGLEYDIMKTTGLTKEQLGEVTQELDKMSVAVGGFDLTELYKIAEASGQVGVAKEDLKEYTKQMEYVALSSTIAGEDAATGFAKIANAVGLPLKDINHLTSAITVMSSKTAASEEVLLDSFSRIGGAGHTALGLTNADMVAIGATMEDVGINVEVGGTAISDMFMKMIADTDKFAKASGVSLSQYKKMMEDKPIKAVELFLSSLSKMNKENKVDVLKALGLSGGGSIRTILTLSDSTEKLAKNVDIATEAYKNGNATQAEALTKSEALEAQQQRSANAITLLQRKIGEGLKPTMLELNEATVKAINWTSEHTDTIQTLAVGVGIATSAYYLLTTAQKANIAWTTGAGAIGLVGEIARMNQLQRSIAIATASQRALNIALRATPWGLAITGATLLGTALYRMYQIDQKRHQLALDVTNKIATGDYQFNKDNMVVKSKTQSMKDYNSSLKAYNQNLSAIKTNEKILKNSSSLNPRAKKAIEDNIQALKAKTSKLKENLDWEKESATFEGNSFAKATKKHTVIISNKNTALKNQSEALQKLLHPAKANIANTKTHTKALSDEKSKLREVASAQKEFEDKYNQATLSNIEYQKHRLVEQKKYYEKHNVDKLKIAKWYNAELAKIEEKANKDRVEKEKKANKEAIKAREHALKLQQLQTTINEKSILLSGGRIDKASKLKSELSIIQEKMKYAKDEIELNNLTVSALDKKLAIKKVIEARNKKEIEHALKLKQLQATINEKSMLLAGAKIDKISKLKSELSIIQEKLQYSKDDIELHQLTVNYLDKELEINKAIEVGKQQKAKIAKEWKATEEKQISDMLKYQKEVATLHGDKSKAKEIGYIEEVNRLKKMGIETTVEELKALEKKKALYETLSSLAKNMATSVLSDYSKTGDIKGALPI